MTLTWSKLTNYASQSQEKTPERENTRISLNKEPGYVRIIYVYIN